MELDFVGFDGKSTISLKHIDGSTDGYKYRSRDLTVYLVESGQSSTHSEFTRYRRCLVARKEPTQWSGYFGSNDQGITSAWRSMSSLDRLQVLKSSLESAKKYSSNEEPAGRASVVDIPPHNLLFTGIDFFNSNGVVDYAFLQPKGQRLSRQEFCLSRREIHSAASNIFSALKLLHSMNVLHNNISVDSVLFDPTLGVFLLTDLFCLVGTDDFNSSTYGNNPLYTWLERILQGMQKSTRLYKFTRRMGDIVALLCVLKYMSTLDRFCLLNSDPLEIRSREMMWYGSAVKSLSTPRTSEGTDTRVGLPASVGTATYLEAKASGSEDLDKALEWIASLQGIVKPSESYTILGNGRRNIAGESESRSRLVGLLEGIERREERVDTALKYSDHMLFPSRLEENLMIEPNEDSSIYLLRRRLSLVNYVWLKDSLKKGLSYYMSDVIVHCFASASNAAAEVDRYCLVC